MKEKIEQYRKIIDKKINEITHSGMMHKTLNKSSFGATPDSQHDRSSSNHSFLAKDKSNNILTLVLDNSSFKSFRKNDPLIKNLDNATKKILLKDNFRTHYRHSSMGSIDFKSDSKIKTAGMTNFSHNSNNHNVKNIHAMKEMLFNNLPVRESKVTSTSKKRTNGTESSSNIVLNPAGNPCFNHITIYTTNNTANLHGKAGNGNDTNLRQYIFNKVTAKPKSLSKIK